MILSEKQLKSIQDSDARLNFWHGSVRSGKSYASLWRFFHFLRFGPPGPCVIVGRTTHTIVRNIIDPMKEVLGNSVKYLVGRQYIDFFGRTIHVIPASDARAESRLRGSTVVGAYVDEASLIPENFFKMLLSRLSMKGAKLFATTNPDSPLHWIKRDFLDRKDQLDLKDWHFKLEDNPSLEKEYIKQIKKEYVGLWYDRYILGEWVQAEGAVYDFFDKTIHCIDYPQHQAKSYILGIDYGTSNAFAAVLIGINPNYYPNVWVEDEYYWDARKEMRQKTNVEYADDLEYFLRGKHIESIYVDPSAASFKLELRRKGFDNVYDSENEVVEGIRKVSEYLSAGTMKICLKAKNLIGEIQGYVWDAKAQERGEDKPVKSNDHACFVAGTKIGKDQVIEDIGIGDLVLTRKGARRVNGTSKVKKQCYEFDIMGRKVKCTEDHKILTVNSGWKEVGRLLQCDMLITFKEDWIWKGSLGKPSLSSGEERSTEDTLNLLTLLKETIINAEENICIEKCGEPLAGRSLKDIIYITSTKTPLIILCPTSNVYLQKNTVKGIKEIVKKSFQTRQGKRLLCGTSLKLEGNGIPSKQQNPTLVNGNPKNTSVNHAQTSFSQPKDTKHGFVRINVSLKCGEVLELMMSIEFALTVNNLSESISIPKLVTAPKVVPRKDIGVRNVYNISVEEDPEYFAEGFLVHNCDALRYAIYTHFFGKDDFNPLTPHKLDEMYLESRGMAPNLPKFFQDPNKQF